MVQSVIQKQIKKVISCFSANPAAVKVFKQINDNNDSNITKNNVKIKTITDVKVDDLIVLHNKHVCEVQSIVRDNSGHGYKIKGVCLSENKEMVQSFTNKDINIVYQPIIFKTSLFVQQGIIKD